jgi:hypothetical protein
MSTIEISESPAEKRLSHAPVKPYPNLFAFKMHLATKSGAAVVAEMKESTFVHRSLGRRAAKDYYISQRLLKAEL